MTDNAGNLFYGVPILGVSTTTRCSWLFVCFAPITNASHTFTFTCSLPSLAVAAFSGACSTVDKVSAGAVTASGTSLSPTSITPSQDNALIVTGICNNTNVTDSINAGFTITDQIGGTVAQHTALAYLIQTSVAAAAPTWSFASAAGASSMMALPLSGGYVVVA